MLQPVEDRNKCECEGGPSPVPNAEGGTTCCVCGLVLEVKPIDHENSGVRSYTAEEEQRRRHTGDPIDPRALPLYLANKLDLAGVLSPELKRAAKWNTRISWRDKAQIIAIQKIKFYSNSLNLPVHIRTEAFYVFKHTQKNALLRGKSLTSSIGASLYIACRINQLPFLIGEIAKAMKIGHSEITTAYRGAAKTIKLNLSEIDLKLLIQKIGVKFGLETREMMEIHKLTTKFLTINPCIGKNRYGIVAGAFYFYKAFVRGPKFSQERIAEAFHVTVVTLRTNYRAFKRLMGEE